MPAQRRPVDACHDHTIVDGEYCIDCGRSFLDHGGDEVDEDLRWKVIGGWAALVGGSIMIGVGQVYMRQVMAMSIGKSAITDPVKQEQANNLAYWLIRGGGLLLVVGIVSLLLLPAVKRRRFLV
jgi:hypothetical protein